jgi:glutathione S-transferase
MDRLLTLEMFVAVASEGGFAAAARKIGSSPPAVTRGIAALEARLGDGDWATPYGFTLADCAAAPALFYADWVHPIDPAHAKVRAYRARHGAILLPWKAALDALSKGGGAG